MRVWLRTRGDCNTSRTVMRRGAKRGTRTCLMGDLRSWDGDMRMMMEGVVVGAGGGRVLCPWGASQRADL